VPTPTARPRTRRADPDAFEGEEEERAPFIVPEEEDEAEAPRPRKRAAKKPAQALGSDDEETGDEEGTEDSVPPPISRGRTAIKASRPGFDTSIHFKWGEKGGAQVVKFLENEPWSYLQHWEERPGKKSFTCAGDNCPLCDVGSEPRQKIVYSVVNLSLEEPKAQAMEISPSTEAILAEFDADRKTGPLTRLWWSVSRSKGSKNSYGYNYVFTPIKDRDLEDDYDIALDEAEAIVKKSKPIDPVQVIGKVNRRRLQEIADEAYE
jgi:hypothetical protein